MWRLPVPLAILLSVGSGFGTAASAGAAETSTPTLTNIQQVLSLGLAGAMEATYPVRVQGVVAFSAIGTRELMRIHDGEAGLGVSLITVPGFRAALSQPKVGDLVEVTGETAAGSSHPYVARATARILGPGEFVEPRPTRASALAAGRHHGDLVRLPATVLDVARVRGRAVYLLAADGYRFHADDSEPSDQLPSGLLNAKVEIQCMPWTQFDAMGRPSGFRLLVGRRQWVRVIQAGSSNLFAGRRQTIAAVGNAPLGEDRVVVSGVVAYSWPNHFVALSDPTGTVIAYPFQPIAPSVRDADYVPRPPKALLRAGDRIELVGSKNSRRPYSPQLNNSEYRVIGREDPPEPIGITEAKALAGEHDCRRVRIQGRILDRDTYSQFGAKVSRLWIKFGEQTTYAVFAGSNHVEFPAPTGSRVELTGLCVVNAGTERPVRNFAIYLESPGDVRRLPEPPVWLNPVGLRIGGASGGVLAMALGWVWLLRRQVSRQTAELRQSNRQLEEEMRERARAEAGRAARMKLLALNGEIAVALNETVEARPMLQRCAEIIARHLDAAFVRVWTLNDAAQALELQAGAGCRTQLDGPQSRVPIEQFPIGVIARDKQPYLTNDVPGDARVGDAEWARQEGTTAFAGYPLMLEGRVLGVVALFARQPLGEEILQSLASAAYSIALGIERKRSEAELRRALARERELGVLKTSFVSMVSHEFRTPLEVIVSSADILDRYLDRLPKPDRAEHLGAIQSSVRRMSDMMEHVLLLGRFESDRQPFHPDDLHLTALCRRLAGEIQATTGGKCPIRLELDDTLPLARSDEKLLRHILLNLLSNAVKYSPPGSPVTLGLRRDGAQAVLRVEDSGLGIPQADQPHVFEAFHRGRNTGQFPGTGLGLVIVKRSVDLHGGRIEFTSDEGKGTRFTVRLPVFTDPEP